MSEPPLLSLIGDRALVICSGAGGVGKTTTSAAIGLAAARAGRKAGVLTIDPARRLADALGLASLPNEPEPVAAGLLEGGVAGGSLHALMLDPKQTFDQLVRRIETEENAERILNNRLYQNVSGMLAGIQEYTAGEKLHELYDDPRFDLVVVDTPPTRNALDFLEAPGALSRFLDERVLRLFLPAEARRFSLLRSTGKVVTGVLGRVFGEGFTTELAEFLSILGGITATLRVHAEEVRALLSSERATFLLITAPQDAALQEALFFRERLDEWRLPFGGYVVNRLRPDLPETTEAELEATERALAAELGAARAAELLGRLEAAHAQERHRALHDRALVERLRARGGAPIVGIPLLEGAADGLLPEMVRLAFRYE
jgi:anion-transporting  ArsA/GET3 family ATPase